MNHRVLDLGDAAFTIEFGDTIDPALRARVEALDVAIGRAREQGGLDGLIETVPTFRSLTVIYDPLMTERATLIGAIAPLAGAASRAPREAARHWLLPACYEGAAAPDLADVARAIGADTDTVVRLHSETEYVVYMLGFLPGFPFMGDVPGPLRLPRRHEPRVRVPAGSVAIAAGLTAIYPWESPGGWHLLARCPVPLFDIGRAMPALLRTGDRVRFDPVSSTELASLERRLAARELEPDAWCTTRGQTQ